MCTRSSLLIALATAIAAAQGPRASGSSVLSGIVLDAAGNPIDAAEIQMRVKGTVVRFVRSGVDGTFRFPDLPVGPVDFSVRRIGFQLKTFTLDMAASEESPTMFLTLAPAATHLDSMLVIAAAPTTGPLADFRRRQLEGLGTFFDSSAIAKYGATHVDQLLARAPGVVLVPAARGKYNVRMNSMGGTCTPTVYLDGVAVRDDADDATDVEEVRAVEVYTHPTDLPPEYFDAKRRNCGGIVLWTSMTIH